MLVASILAGLLLLLPLLLLLLHCWCYQSSVFQHSTSNKITKTAGSGDCWG